MSQLDVQKLQQMVETLTKRVAELERYVPNVEKRVTRLEDDIKAAKRAAANKSGVRP